jgi:hypothetical protein
MIRRNVNMSTSLQGSSNSTPVRTRPGVGRKTSDSAFPSTSSPFCNIWFLLALAAFVTVTPWAFPEKVAEVEQEAEREVNMVEDWWAGTPPRGPPIPEHEHPAFRDSKEAATQRMMQQESKWVDGEKKLKVKLKVLAERQKEGKDIGVPVLTRYLGEDIPAWPQEGMSKEEWQKKVDLKYAEMAEEEVVWKARVAAQLRDQHHG